MNFAYDTFMKSVVIIKEKNLFALKNNVIIF